MALVVAQAICRTDNIALLAHDAASGRTAAIDAPDAEAILGLLRKHRWQLDLILVTHSHPDHVAGIRALKDATGCTVVGPAGEAEFVPGLDRPVREGDVVAVGETIFDVMDVPGHTVGHVAYWSAGAGVAFVGDALFSLGCGRRSEPAPIMWSSLLKLRSLPRGTEVYCGHDNTIDNGRFAVTIEPNNIDLEARIAEAVQLRSAGLPTLPTTIGIEQGANPFLRADRSRLRRALGMTKVEPMAVFAELRRRKDVFR